VNLNFKIQSIASLPKAPALNQCADQIECDRTMDDANAKAV
jgi:hypothetical protein